MCWTDFPRNCNSSSEMAHSVWEINQVWIIFFMCLTFCSNQTLQIGCIYCSSCSQSQGIYDCLSRNIHITFFSLEQFLELSSAGDVPLHVDCMHEWHSHHVLMPRRCNSLGGILSLFNGCSSVAADKASEIDSLLEKNPVCLIYQTVVAGLPMCPAPHVCSEVFFMITLFLMCPSVSVTSHAIFPWTLAVSASSDMELEPTGTAHKSRSYL